MQDKYASDIKHMLSVLAQIAVLIDDNNQNMKDCKKILDDLQKELKLDKPITLKDKVFKFIFK